MLILGAASQLAHELIGALARDEVAGLSHSELDIRDGAAVDACARKYKPDCLVNTAAFRHVDDCEDEVSMSFAVNAVAVGNLVRAANEMRASLVHFSTNHVFDGSQRIPYTEADLPNPLSIYAMSKLAGEHIVRRYAARYFLIRTAGFYGRASVKSARGNVVENMLRLAQAQQPIRVVNDQVSTPTSAKDLAEKTALLIHSGKYGLYHVTNSGECTWHDFAREIFRLAAVDVPVEPISSRALHAKARRPAYSVLDNKSLREAGLGSLRPWQEALADYLAERNSGAA